MKTKDILDGLYDLFQEKIPCHTDDMAILQAKKKLDTLMDDSEAENAILDYGIAYEKAGFHYGFILAVCIMSQCINEIPVSTS